MALPVLKSLTLRVLLPAILLIFTFIAFTSPAIGLQASNSEPEREYGFIEHLFAIGETSSTISEGLRFIYHYPSHPFTDRVRMLIGRSCLAEENHEKAVETFKGIAEGASREELREEAEFWLSNALIKQGNLSAARRRCDEFLIRYPQSPLREKIRLQKAWSFMMEWQWEAAEHALQEIDQSSDLFKPSQEMAGEIRDLRSYKGKSPLAAGILSLLVPGAGYVYAGKWQTGIAALVVNGVFIGATIESFDNDLPILGSIIGLVELGWYSGTVYGSVRASKQYNYRFSEERLRSLSQRFTLPLLQIGF